MRSNVGKRNLVLVKTLPKSLLLDQKEVERYNGYYKSITELPPITKLIRSIGNNTGNFFFNEALVKQLGYENCDFVHERDILGGDVDFLRENIFHGYDAVFYPTANFLRRDNMVNAQALIEKTLAASDAKMMIVGLGAQLAEDESPSKEMLYTLTKAAERCHSIGVRGEQTADALKLAGIKNVDVIGCPSVFYSLNPAFRMEKKPFDADNYKYLYYGELDKPGIDFMLRNKSERGAFVIQNEPFFFYDYDQEALPDWADIKISQGVRERCYDITDQKIELLDEIIRKESLVFSSMYDWLTTVGKFDFSYGPRFHGNMAALQAGVPALFVRHDSRTKELIDSLFLPCRTYAELEEKTIPELYEQLDYSLFNKAYPLLYSRYRNFLDNNGIPHLMPPGVGQHLILSDMKKEMYSASLQLELDERVKECALREKEIEEKQQEIDGYKWLVGKHKKKKNKYKKILFLITLLLVLMCLWLAYILI